MRAGGSTRRANVADDFATFDFLPRTHRELREMPEPGTDPEAVGHDNRVTVVALISGRLDGAVRCRADWRSAISRNIEPGVVVRLTGERILP